MAMVAEWSSSWTPGPGERGAHDHSPVLVDDELGGALHAVAQRVGAGHVAGAVLDGAHVDAPLAGLRFGEPDRAHLRVGEGDPRHHVLVGHVDGRRVRR